MKTIKQLLEVIPDAALVDSLTAARGKGRNDYAIRTLWGVLVLSIALRHPTIEACLAELRRNESLRKLIGIESEDAVPQKWNLSRFLGALGDRAQLPLLHGLARIIHQPVPTRSVSEDCKRAYLAYASG